MYYSVLDVSLSVRWQDNERTDLDMKDLDYELIIEIRVYGFICTNGPKGRILSIFRGLSDLTQRMWSGAKFDVYSS